MQDNLKRLSVYQQHIKDKLSSTTLPKKHLKREASYKQFLNRELSAVTEKIESLKLEGAK